MIIMDMSCKTSSISMAKRHAASPDIPGVIRHHPCFSPKAAARYGRMHLPVAPRCNTQCNYCVRKYDCVNESRPGVTSKILSAEDALEQVREMIERHAYIRTIGFAGPGDPLANPETFDTIALIRRDFPALKICLSTNGLALSHHVNDFLKRHVSTLTVTVNTVAPQIGQHIYKWVRDGHRTYCGLEGAELLIRRQLDGIGQAVRVGIVVKVNSILIPGVNSGHLHVVAEKCRELGVYIQNIIPLIPQGNFKDIPPPTKNEVNLERKRCAAIIPQMHHCKRCRADAVGLLAEHGEKAALSCVQDET